MGLVKVQTDLHKPVEPLPSSGHLAVPCKVCQAPGMENPLQDGEGPREEGDSDPGGHLMPGVLLAGYHHQLSKATVSLQILDKLPT